MKRLLRAFAVSFEAILLSNLAFRLFIISERVVLRLIDS
jgi:hypothetical protein